MVDDGSSVSSSACRRRAAAQFHRLCPAARRRLGSCHTSCWFRQIVRRRGTRTRSSAIGPTAVNSTTSWPCAARPLALSSAIRDAPPLTWAKSATMTHGHGVERLVAGVLQHRGIGALEPVDGGLGLEVGLDARAVVAAPSPAAARRSRGSRPAPWPAPRHRAAATRRPPASLTRCGTPPARVATTGRPHAIASRMLVANGSP